MVGPSGAFVVSPVAAAATDCRLAPPSPNRSQQIAEAQQYDRLAKQQLAPVSADKALSPLRSERIVHDVIPLALRSDNRRADPFWRGPAYVQTRHEFLPQPEQEIQNPNVLMAKRGSEDTRSWPTAYESNPFHVI